MGKKCRWRKSEAVGQSEAANLPQSSGCSSGSIAGAEGPQAGSHQSNVADSLFSELMQAARQEPKAPSAPSARGSEQMSSSGALGGRRPTPGPGEAYFPVMSPEDIAALSLPANAPEETLRRVFEEHGVLVVTGVLSKEECDLMERLFLQDLLQLIDTARPKDRETAETLERLQRYGLRSWPAWWNRDIGYKGTASHHGLPHGWFAWSARLHPRVRRVFSALYSVPEDELAVGLDVPFWSAADDEPAATNKEWLHVDQNHRTGMTWQCAQGVLYVWPSAGETSSCTVAWPGSHRDEYQRLMMDGAAAQRGKRTGGQSVHVNLLHDGHLRDELLGQATQGGAAKRIPCPAGSLLLWDSRIIHQGWKGGPRLAQPVCWEPRERRKPAALRQKRHMCATGVPSTHSAAEGRVHNMIKGRSEATGYREGCPFFKDAIVPWAVAPEKRGEWRAALDELWGPGGDPKRGVQTVDTAVVQALLRAEAEASL